MSGLTGDQLSWWTATAPYAAIAAADLGAGGSAGADSARTIEQQWAYETGFGTSQAALLDNNLAGIKPTSQWSAGPDSKYAGFGTLGRFARAYADVLKLPRYQGARQQLLAGANAGTFGTFLQREGYATDPAYGQELGAFAAGLPSLPIAFVPSAAGASGSVLIPTVTAPTETTRIKLWLLIGGGILALLALSRL